MSDTIEDKALLRELKDFRRLMHEQQVALLEVVRYMERIDRRVDGMGKRLGEQITELKEDFSTILKAELGGALAHLETRLEQRFAPDASDDV